MYCHKCGSSIHAAAVSCSHCGVKVDHQSNMENFQPSNIVLARKNTLHSYSKKIKNSMILNFIVWLSLALPAITLPYIFKWAAEPYQHFSFTLAYISLAIILFSISYFVKKGFTKPVHNTHN